MLTLQIALGVALGILVAFYVIKNQGNFTGLLTKILVYSLLLIAFLANLYYLYFLQNIMKIGETLSKYLDEENYFLVVFTILFLLGLVIKFGSNLSYLIYGNSKSREDNVGLNLALGIVNLDIFGALNWILSKISITESASSLYVIGIYALATIIRYVKDKKLKQGII